MKNKIYRVLIIIFLLEMIISIIIIGIKLKDLYTKANDINKKLNQIELDYRFLEYNTEQKYEVEYGSR